MRDVGKGWGRIQEDAPSAGAQGGDETTADLASQAWRSIRVSSSEFEPIRVNSTSRQGPGDHAPSTLPRQNDLSQFKQIQVNSSKFKHRKKDPPPIVLPNSSSLRAFIFMILSCHDSVSCSSSGRACRIPLTFIPLTFPLSFASSPALNGCWQFRANSSYFEIIRDNSTSRQGEGGDTHRHFSSTFVFSRVLLRPSNALFCGFCAVLRKFNPNAFPSTAYVPNRVFQFKVIQGNSRYFFQWTYPPQAHHSITSRPLFFPGPAPPQARPLCRRYPYQTANVPAGLPLSDDVLWPINAF
jgi:hypothetical protein